MDIPLVIIYDVDVKTGINAQVQAAAAQLGYDLRFRGVKAKNIRQLNLVPHVSYLEEKIGLDDYLMHPKLGPKEFDLLLNSCLNSLSAFPKHPNPRAFINKKLSKGRLPRSDVQALSTAVLCDLDSKGVRLHCPDDDELYYFSRQTHELKKVTFKLDAGFAKTPFGVMMYKDYNLTGNDFSLLQNLSSQYAGEDPVVEVSPERVMCIRGDTLYLQVSNGRVVKVNADAIFMQENGQDDILFESGAVVPADEAKLKEHIGKHQKTDTLPFNWYEVIKGARVKDSEDDRDRKILALLYCISPWMYRWRGTQLPIEMMIAEPGSGKSTLYQLRLNIMSGVAKLRNAPKDLRDWTASVSGAGGLHVTDNVHMGDNSLRQELSDELCRVITAHNPVIERRKLYSDNDVVETPVKCVFAVTAIKQPF
ncbi:hypothetical protein VJI76_08240, partial [Parvimonas sp. M13]|nr:hypothetical protein [Parvimonas sp. M13]